MSQRYDDICVKITVDENEKVHVKIHLACQAPRRKPTTLPKPQVNANLNDAGEWNLPIARKM
jgi:hypothetical protein